MLDSMRFEVTDLNIEKGYNKESNKIEVKTNKFLVKNQEVKINPKLNGDYLLMYYGLTLDNNEENDCLSLSLTFSERKDDKLIAERTKFFSKYFLFDRNHFDIIEECLNPSKPFDRRVMFYYYVLMMDALDLEKEDPKRKDLQDDKLIVNYTKENLNAIENLNKSNLEDEEQRFSNENNRLIKQFIKYKIQQRKILRKVIAKFEDQYNMLVKDESL